MERDYETCELKLHNVFRHGSFKGQVCNRREGEWYYRLPRDTSHGLPAGDLELIWHGPYETLDSAAEALIVKH